MVFSYQLEIPIFIYFEPNWILAEKGINVYRDYFINNNNVHLLDKVFSAKDLRKWIWKRTSISPRKIAKEGFKNLRLRNGNLEKLVTYQETDYCEDGYRKDYTYTIEKWVEASKEDCELYKYKVWSEYKELMKSSLIKKANDYLKKYIVKMLFSPSYIKERSQLEELAKFLNSMEEIGATDDPVYKKILNWSNGLVENRVEYMDEWAPHILKNNVDAFSRYSSGYFAEYYRKEYL